MGLHCLFARTVFRYFVRTDRDNFVGCDDLEQSTKCGWFETAQAVGRHFDRVSYSFRTDRPLVASLPYPAHGSSMNPMKIATIVGSNSHVLYIGRLADGSADGAILFGTFVSIPSSDGSIIGIVCDSRLIDPDLARTSPGSQGEYALADVRGDLLNEKKALVAIMLIGHISASRSFHEIPRSVISAGTAVESMSKDEIDGFHRNVDGQLQIHYLADLMAQTGALGTQLAKFILHELSVGTSVSDKRRLEVMADALNWKHAFGESKF